MTRFVIPFCMYYMESGEFSRIRRIKSAFATIMYWSLGIAVVFLGFLVYLIGSGRMEVKSIPVFVIACTNS